MTYPNWEETKNNFFWHKDPPMITEDMPTFMGVPCVKTAADLEGADIIIIGSSYVAGPAKELWGVDKTEWASAAKRVRQQSLHYRTGYIVDFDLDIFEHLKVVDYGNPDFELPPFGEKTPEEILKAQTSVEQKVNDALDVGAIPIVIGQNSPCSSYAIAKPIAERTQGNVGVVSLDTHWDINAIDEDTSDSRIAGAANWKQKMYDSHENIHPKHLVEIGERGMLEIKERVRWFLEQGAHFYSMWHVRQVGIEKIAKNLSYAYEGTDAIYAHFDMD
ncbi:MAG: agmatinase, partial [Anaerolineae bacterium]|nr:agmatinase [Anaerolineae bacterium]